MPILDIILIVIVVAFVLYGFFLGFIKTLGNLIGSVFGIYLTSLWLEKAIVIVSRFWEVNEIGRVIVFFSLLIVISKSISVLFWSFDKMFKLASIIPFAGLLNRALGAVLGATESLILIGIVLYFAQSTLPFTIFSTYTASSSIVPIILNAAQHVSFLIPSILQSVQSRL